MAYIKTTERLIHVKEGLAKLKRTLFKPYTGSEILQNKEFITVTEFIPEIDIYLEERRFLTRYSDSRTAEQIESMWNDKKEKLTKRNEKLSKGRKILIRIKDIIELHDER